MSAAQFLQISSRSDLVGTYALKTVNEAAAAVRAKGGELTPEARRYRTYDQLNDLLWERLQEAKLVDMAMSYAGEFGDMHAKYRGLEAEKEARKVADAISLKLDMRRDELVEFWDGAVFARRDHGITYARLTIGGLSRIEFSSKDEFLRWAGDAHIPKDQSLRALAFIHATRKHMSTVQEAAPADTKYIGATMPKPQWAEARDAVSDPGKNNGKVFLPKPQNEYAGKLLHMTETHLVQQVGKNSAVIHDLSKLENGVNLAQSFDKKELRPRTHVVIKYGEERGVGEVVPFSAQRAAEVKKEGIAWAEQNIKAEKTRALFVKQLEAFTAEMAKGAPQPARQAAAPRAPDRAPQLERQH